MSHTKIQKIVLFMTLSVFLLVFLKNAWVTDDAYIVFRSIEQLFAGNGPRWNPHERVQVFTSPFWFWILSLFRVFSRDVFWNVIVVSAMLSILTIFLVKKILQDNRKWILFLILLLCSNAFLDYTSSGLENPLGFFLITVYVYYYHYLFLKENFERAFTKLLFKLLLSFGFILIYRHDLVTLVFLPTVYVCWYYRKQLTLYNWCVFWGIALLPFIGWSFFSLVYYGSIFPNTAYAKLNTGIEHSVLLGRGIDYLLASLRYDTITFLAILIALCSSFISKKTYIRFLGYGVTLNLAYVVYVGGDFMQGRFLSYAYLLAVIILLLYGSNIHIQNNVYQLQFQIRDQRKAFVIIGIGCLLYMLFYPHTPVNSSLHYKNQEFSGDVADERGHYFETSSLWQYISNNTEEYFPQHPWSKEGYLFSKSPLKYYGLRGSTGYFGYWAGIDKIIIDELALSDPFLARLPVPKGEWWRIGHYLRKFPEGYKESIMHNSAELVDPDLNEYYKRLRSITQSDDLWTWERIKTIIAMNLGWYDSYIESKYKEQKI